MSRTLWALAVVLCCLGSAAEAAGIQLLESDPALSGAIWYPCAAEPKPVSLGRLSVGAEFDLKGAKDCPVTGAKLPLVIFSHGRGGWFGQNHDTVEALADAGFIVAAINHPGDTFSDSSRRDTLSVWGSRPLDMVRLLDFMLNDWKDRAVIDPTKVGFFGFSLGGYTGFALMGTKPDFARVASLCKDTTGTCAQLHNGETLPDPPQDARIRAAVIVDPAPNVLTRENLAAVKVPFQFWRSQFGGPGVGDGSGTARVADGLPGKPDVHVVPAGHFAFLAPCTEEQAAAVPRICADVPAGFDRAAFHREFNAAVAIAECPVKTELTVALCRRSQAWRADPCIDLDGCLVLLHPLQQQFAAATWRKRAHLFAQTFDFFDEPLPESLSLLETTPFHEAPLLLMRRERS